MNLILHKLIRNNTFFQNQDFDAKLNYIKQESNESFGEESVMYYFYRKGYSINFIHNETKNIIASEQIEIQNEKNIEDEYLRNVISVSKFIKKHNNDIELFFEDFYDNENEKTEVAFLKNGVSFHFYNGILKKIISKCEFTKLFIEKHMVKKEYKKTTHNMV